MYAIDPDPDWYLDHVLLAAGPDGEFVGPARQKLAEWQRRRLALSDVAVGRHALGGSTAFERAGALAADQGFVLTYAQARSCGVDRAQLRRLQRRGQLWYVRRSVLCPLPELASGAAARTTPAGNRPATTGPADDTADGVSANDPAVAAAAAALIRRGAWISHESAALAYGLPVLDMPARPIVTHPRVAAAEGRDGLLVHAAPMPLADQASWFGAPISSVARTVIDIARCSGTGAGLVVADAALRESLTTRKHMASCVARMSCWPGVRAARDVVRLADGLAESPLESLARLCLHQAELPAPTLQAWVQTDRGRFGSTCSSPPNASWWRRTEWSSTPSPRATAPGAMH